MEAPAASARPLGHPHRADEFDGDLPDPIPQATLRELSEVSVAASLGHTALEWAMIAAAIVLALRVPHPVTYVAAVLFIGARHHALTLLMHDASHYRYLRHHGLNDWVADVLVAWPVFLSLPRYRAFHMLHHRHLGEETDGNRVAYMTHSKDGVLHRIWVYPKTHLQLVLLLLMRLVEAPFILLYILWLDVSEAVLVWIGKGELGEFIRHYRKPPSRFYVTVKVAADAGIGLAVWQLGIWKPFLLLWIVPWCWHLVLQQIRLIGEHFAIDNDHPFYQQTRSTKLNWLESLLYLPKNANLHLEHHIHPSVPFHRLPKLHALLMEQDGFRERAQVTQHLTGLLKECVRRPGTRR
jgi:fatty acid desaturase